MMEITHRHCRYFHRKISRCATLYTEMITCPALIHGDRDQLLGFDAAELPLVLQLGGSDPKQMAQCATMGEDFGYTAININVGCPSDRVKSGRFGACLMAEPEIVGECVSEMQKHLSIPVTVKCRIGIDRDDSFEPFEQFVCTVSEAGCETFIVHARKAWLDGLSPKENRTIPPLRYEFVRQIKALYPHLNIALNGGLTNHDQCFAEAKNLDGVMMGREACSNPWVLNPVDNLYFDAEYDAQRSRFDIVESMYEYIEEQRAADVPLGALLKPMLGLFHAQPGGRLWRRILSETMWTEGAGVHTVEKALQCVKDTTDAMAQRAAS